MRTKPRTLDTESHFVRDLTLAERKTMPSHVVTMVDMLKKRVERAPEVAYLSLPPHHLDKVTPHLLYRLLVDAHRARAFMDEIGTMIKQLQTHRPPTPFEKWLQHKVKTVLSKHKNPPQPLQPRQKCGTNVTLSPKTVTTPKSHKRFSGTTKTPETPTTKGHQAQNPKLTLDSNQKPATTSRAHRSERPDRKG